jgi:hypothetical protein
MNPEEEQKKALWREEKFREFREELLQNESLKKFLENIYPHSRDSFISEYAQAKVRWIEWGPKHLEWNQHDDLQWLNDAMDCLGEIQQKKLFDMQCQWRAEKIEIPKIRITYDFYYWEKYIFDCPFLSPVTREELDTYIQYLQSSNFEPAQGWMDRWQDYDEIKEAYNSENANRNFPEWYDFHNGRTGASAFMLFPDIRGQKEEFYLSLWRKEKHGEHEKAKKEAEEIKSVTEAAGISLPQEKSLPSLDFHKRGWLTWFVTTFEDKETRKVFEQYGGETIYNSNYDEFVEKDLETLRTSEKPVPVEGWYDWKEAIHRAALKYATRKIIEALPLAYEQYSMNIDLKIPFSELGPNKDKWFADGILRGRELNGEPRDFNF